MFETLNLSYTNISLIASLTISISLGLFSLFSWLINKKDKLSFWIFLILLIGTNFYFLRILRFSLQDEIHIIIASRLSYIPFILIICLGYYYTLAFTKSKKSTLGKYLFDYFVILGILLTLFTPLTSSSNLFLKTTSDGFAWGTGLAGILTPFITSILIIQQLYIIFILYQSTTIKSKAKYILIGGWTILMFFYIYESYSIIYLKNWIRLEELVFIPLALVHYLVRILESNRLYLNLDKLVLQKTKELSTANEEIKDKYDEMKQATDTIHRLNTDLNEANTKIENSNTFLSAENIYLHDEIKDKWNMNFIVGKSGRFRNMLQLVENVAPTNTSVLITGETGTGKEIISQAIYNISQRNKKSFIKLNCASIPENLIESELFGHEKGAFTGAISTKLGRFELAHKGTLFLDEVGDLPLNLQSKLLRVIQEGEFERIGGTKTIKVDVRIISATNKDLEAEIKKGLFRSDLYYRLNIFPIHLPSLRERSEDIPLFIDFFVDKYAKLMNKNISIISSQIIDTLKTYSWPGNIRELENIIERSVVITKGSKLILGDSLKLTEDPKVNEPFLTLDEIQKNHILSVLQKTKGKIAGDKGAAKILGIKPTTLNSRMLKLEME